jgi:hypothetical protein
MFERMGRRERKKGFNGINRTLMTLIRLIYADQVVKV